MLKNFFNKQVPTLLKNKKLLIAIIAIIFVPILYAGMFLWAFWDPYDQLEDIPVAIVNEDEGFYFEGEYLTLGEELVDKLKEEAAFDFHFVNKQTGYQGLNDQDYYILIEIPSDFSENSTTVMDDSPKQIELNYVPNESYNFLASQMGETAMLQIEQTLEENIIETYAETIFDKIDEVAEGLTEASDATEELNEGAHDLKDGSETLNEHLATLASKSIEFKEGVNTASEGSKALDEGTKEIASGISELYDNSNKLLHASGDLQSGAGQLSEGTNEITLGLREVYVNIPQLIDGTNQLYDGLNEFSQALPVEMSKEIKGKVDEGSQTIMAGTKQLQTGIINGLENELAPQLSQGLTSGLSSGLSEGIVGQVNDMIGNAPENISDRISKDITRLLKDFDNQKKQELIEVLKKANVSEDVIVQIEDKLDEMTPNYDRIGALVKEKINTALTSVLDDVQLTPEQQDKLAGLIKAQIEEGIENGVNEAVDQTVMSINDGFDEYSQAILAGLSDATNDLEAQIKQALNDPIEQLQQGVVSLNEGQNVLQGGINQLYTGANQLNSGSKSLVAGQNEYVDNMMRFTSSFARAQAGSNDLAEGASTLNRGMDLLKDGSYQLSDGADQLLEGSDELHEGMETLVDGTEEFNDQMNDAVDEVNDVNTTEETYSMISNPVQVENEKINEVPNYGTGFAPYFLSLGLFVGSLLLSIVYPLREPTVTPTSGTHWFLSKFVGLAMIGILQAFIASGVLLLGLGLEVQSVPLFILYAIITSLTFISLIQFFVTCFDDPGRFIAIIILILQLTTSAGTFPLELIPKVLQPFNMILPMTYTVSGFKAVVSSGEYSVMWQNAFILIGFTIIFMVATLLYFVYQYDKNYSHIKVGEEVMEQ